jgi:hypothetical protein
MPRPTMPAAAAYSKPRFAAAPWSVTLATESRCKSRSCPTACRRDKRIEVGDGKAVTRHTDDVEPARFLGQRILATSLG